MTDTSDRSRAMPGDPDDALLARYLMGVCSEDEKTHVEALLFAGGEVFERLCAIEEELIGRRVSGQLAGDDRERFDRAYAAPPRRDRVLFARALTTVVADEPPAEAGAVSAAREAGPRTSRWTAFWQGWGLQLAFAAGVVLIAGVAVLGWRAAQLRTSLASLQADNDALRRQAQADRQRVSELEARAAAAAELERQRAAGTPSEPSRPAATRAVTFALVSGLLRSARAPARLVLPPSTDEVRLVLDLDPGIDARRFRAELRDAQSRGLWLQDVWRSAAGPGPDAAAAVPMTLPAAILRDGEYEVVLSSTADGRQFEETARYYFAVVKK